MDKMHHMSNVGVGGRTELGFFASLLHAAAGAKQDASGSVRR